MHRSGRGAITAAAAFSSIDQRVANVSEPALVLDNVVVAFGALRAVDDVSMSVKRGERRAMIGPNGAGKTTLFNAITGVHPPTSGRIIFEGRT